MSKIKVLGKGERKIERFRAKVRKAKKLMTLALDFWTAPGIDMPDMDTFDAMVRFIGKGYTDKWESDVFIGEPYKPVGMAPDEFLLRRAIEESKVTYREILRCVFRGTDSTVVGNNSDCLIRLRDAINKVGATL